MNPEWRRNRWILMLNVYVDSWTCVGYGARKCCRSPTTLPHTAPSFPARPNMRIIITSDQNMVDFRSVTCCKYTSWGAPCSTTHVWFRFQVFYILPPWSARKRRLLVAPPPGQRAQNKPPEHDENFRVKISFIFERSWACQQREYRRRRARTILNMLDTFIELQPGTINMDFQCKWQGYHCYHQ